MNVNIPVTGNRGLIGSVAVLVGAIGMALKDVANGQVPGNESIMTGIGAIIAIFGFLKGKRIEAKLDALHEKLPEVKP
jgi:hypothetical protein